MPWGVQRLNAPKSQPNANVVFIKPLPGPREKIAHEFLERIAAQCVPIMRRHHLYVMTLEEYEPNGEFVGRNFNAGEVIQLVLRSRRTGRWLPFEYVQMVMMHELAHCKHMNHSRAFWTVRNGYAAEMHRLWREGYRGEGLWGRGASLGTGRWEEDAVRADEEALPGHLCGGTYRSRGRKRKTKPTLTYQERKARRIRNKFGEHGVALGADDDAKARLEKGKKIQARPRVAGSARGRELRAAAALARFEQQKEDAAVDVKEEAAEAAAAATTAAAEASEPDSESEYEDEGGGGDLGAEDAVDVDGHRLVDAKGRAMVKVCEDEGFDDADARKELDELRDVFRHVRVKQESPGPAKGRALEPARGRGRTDHGQKGRGGGITPPSPGRVKDEPAEEAAGLAIWRPKPRTRGASATQARRKASPSLPSSGPGASEASTRSCAMCSFANAPAAATCAMCANVLDAGATAGTWRCRSSAACAASSYVNSGDYGACGLCGQKRADGS